MKLLKKIVAQVLVVSMLGLTAPVQAAMQPTQTILPAQAQAQRAELEAFLDRADVRQQLQQYGVDAQQARERVAALSDSEIAELKGRIGDLPAAGTDVLGVLVFLFVLLLITDILGLTKVFPFTRSVR